MIEKRVSGLEVCIKTLLPISLMWIVFALQSYGILDINQLATSRANGILSILTGTLAHGDMGHIVGNTIPMLVCIPIIVRHFSKHYNSVMFLGFLIPSALMYYLEMPAVGISGLGYALVFFVASAGLWSEDKTKFFIGVGAMYFYGQFLRGATVLAGRGIAWEAHAAGLAVGVLLGILAIKIKK
jgi:membrane associated rhomboid family serine protease